MSRKAVEKMTKRFVESSKGQISEREARKIASQIAERHDRKRDT